jgi:hypothetical protein
MDVLAIDLCVTIQCRNCGRKITRSLPVSPSDEIECECGREIPVDTATLNQIEALKARYVADLRR